MIKISKKVLVIGDSCLDVFQYGKCKRICPEAPVPVFIPTKTKENGGMAMNVKNNLIALGVSVDICTNLFKDNHTPIKKRLIDEVSNQMLVRIDENDSINLIDWDTLTNIEFEKYDAVVISDYNKGFLNEESILFISQHHKLTFMDTKKKLGSWANFVKYIKINEKEYDENRKYLEGERPYGTIATLGKNGAILLSNNNGELNIKNFLIEKEHEIRDLTGAGDTFLAAIVSKFLEKNDIHIAIKFANECASWVVTQKGVAVVDLNRIEL